MSGAKCIIIVTGNLSQGNSRSFVNELIIDAMSAAQKVSANNLMANQANDLFAIAGITITRQAAVVENLEATIESDMIVNSQLAQAAAESVCELAYDFLNDSQQARAVQVMKRYNREARALFMAILGADAGVDA